MIDNHLADQGQKEYEKLTTCPNCGKGNLSEIDWCQNDNCECTEDCPSYSHNLDCVMKEVRLICDNCGAIMEVE